MTSPFGLFITLRFREIIYFAAFFFSSIFGKNLLRIINSLDVFWSHGLSIHTEGVAFALEIDLKQNSGRRLTAAIVAHF